MYIQKKEKKLNNYSLTQPPPRSLFSSILIYRIPLVDTCWLFFLHRYRIFLFVFSMWTVTYCLYSFIRLLPSNRQAVKCKPHWLAEVFCCWKCRRLRPLSMKERKTQRFVIPETCLLQHCGYVNRHFMKCFLYSVVMLIMIKLGASAA